MICDPCKKGANDPLPAVWVNSDERAWRLAMHANCKGGTWCDCQHRPYHREIAQVGRR